MQQVTATKSNTKQRLTAFVDPVLVKRAKIQGAIEGLTISEVVEKALDVYAPKIEEGSDQHIHIKFINGPEIDTLIPEKDFKANEIVPKHNKS